MIRIAICDDNRELCEYLQNLITEKYGSDVNVVLYGNAAELANDYEEGNEQNIADILLMDIKLDGANGIDMAAAIQKRFSEIKVIFITGHIEYSTEIFKVNPNNFLVKPLEPARLYEAIDRAIKQIEEEVQDCFAVTFKSGVFKIKIRDILYFESEKRTVILHGRNSDWTLYKKLADVQEELPDLFLRCHQSYLVNMNEIKSLKPLVLELYNGKTIPVSRPKYKEAKERFLEFLGQNPMNE